MKIKITTPSRLHFGLLDFTGDLGRIDGGAGVALASPGNVLTIHSGKSFKVNGSNPQFIEDIVRRICNKLGKPMPDFEVNIIEEIPHHAGFGSKTQMSLALAYAICREYNVEYYSIEELSHITGRGGTSGIGVRAFEHGGFILDCGHSFGEGKEKTSCLPSSASNAKVAPEVLHCEIPSDWRFVLVSPLNYEGSHGQSEAEIFRSNFPLSETESNKLCRIVLMQMVPGILERDIETFGRAINSMQSIGFKKVEVDLKSPLVPNMLNIMNNAGSYGSGMSSFGPTVFGIADSEKKAANIRNTVTEYLNDMDIPHLSWIAQPNNHGVTVNNLVKHKRIGVSSPVLVN
jgi:beta-ribofuranosylaminobenzene 5'-phosphate synthase